MRHAQLLWVAMQVASAVFGGWLLGLALTELVAYAVGAMP